MATPLLVMVSSTLLCHGILAHADGHFLGKSSNETNSTSASQMIDRRMQDSYDVATSAVMIRWGFDTKFCLTVKNTTFFNGQNIELWECDLASPTQHFRMDSYGYGLIALDADPSYCVVVNGNKNDGSNIQLRSCEHQSVGQWWRIRFGQVQDYGNGKCMVVNNDHGYNGNNVLLYSCTSTSADYRWWSIDGLGKR